MKKIFILLFFICSFANAASISRSTSGSLAISGKTASYSHSPGGTVSSPNSTYQFESSSPLGILLSKPLSPNVIASSNSLFDNLLLKSPNSVKVKTLVSPNSLARSLVNPWSFAASVALQETLGYLADQACVRIAGGQMTNTGGLWEECELKSDSIVHFSCVAMDGKSFVGGSAQEAALGCLPIGTVIGNETVKAYSDVIIDFCGKNCHMALLQTCDSRGVCRNGGSVQMYQSSESVEFKDWRETNPESAISIIESQLKNNTAIQQPIFAALYENGISMETSDAVITGPVSAPVGDPIVTTRTNPDGSVVTTTEQRINNYRYDGNTVTIASTTINNISNNSATNETTTTTTEKPVDEQDDFCKLHPELIACKKIELDTPDGDIPRNTFDITYSEESFLSGGACPADVYLQAGGHQIKAIDWQSHCSRISAYVRPLVILLSSFAALLIIIPGGREVASS